MANCHKPHPEEAALFCAAVSKDGYAHGLVPSFETHRCAMLLRMRLMVGFAAATRLDAGAKMGNRGAIAPGKDHAHIDDG
jgi:hypothetical protein